jgi:transcriptional regulator with XRE-family HTH domain
MQGIEKRFGERVRQLRLKRGWSQDEFADGAGFHRAYIGTVERGEQNLMLASVVKVSKTLGVKLVDLVRGIDD